MGNRRKVLLGLAFVAVVITTTALLSRSSEPTYQGKKLSQWLTRTNILYQHTPQQVRAIRHFGTNAIPWLLEWIGYEPSPLRSALFNMTGKLPQRICATAQALINWHKPLQQANDAWFGFYYLGEDANSAIPQLTQFAISTADPSKSSRCASVLRFLGPDALPALVTIATSTNNIAITRTAGDIVPFRTNALAYVPTLLRALDDNNDWGAYGAATALGSLQLCPETVVPVLTRALERTNIARRVAAATALGDFGSTATSAVPALSRALTDPDRIMRDVATNALRRIAPDLLTNAPTQ